MFVHVRRGQLEGGTEGAHHTAQGMYQWDDRAYKWISIIA